MKKLFYTLAEKYELRHNVWTALKFWAALPFLIVIVCIFFDFLPRRSDELSRSIRLWSVLLIALFEMIQWVIFDQLTKLKAAVIGVLLVLIGAMFYWNIDVKSAYEKYMCQTIESRWGTPECKAYSRIYGLSR